MAVLHRALISWFLCLVFLILLVIRLENRTQWNWFIVFIPMWVFDAAVLTYAVFYIMNRCKNDTFIPQKLYFVGGVVLKLAFEILISLRLEMTSWTIPLYIVFIPLWIILIYVIFRMTQRLVEMTSSSKTAVMNKSSIRDLLMSFRSRNIFISNSNTNNNNNNNSNNNVGNNSQSS